MTIWLAALRLGVRGSRGGADLGGAVGEGGEVLINRRSKRLSFAELVTFAEQAGLLRTSTNGKSTDQLLTELKDLRKNVRHRAADGAGPWLTEHGEDVAICLERLVQNVTCGPNNGIVK